MKAHLGFRSATAGDLEAIRKWLAEEALVQDRPIVLFHLACERLYQLRLTRPGLTVVEQSLVGIAREAARKEIARRLAPSHLGPTMTEHLNVHGRYHFDIDGPTRVYERCRALRETATQAVVSSPLMLLPGFGAANRETPIGRRHCGWTTAGAGCSSRPPRPNPAQTAPSLAHRPPLPLRVA